MKADSHYTIQKSEGWNNNHHGGETGWVVTMDGKFDKPHLFKTLVKACEWISQFSEINQDN